MTKTNYPIILVHGVVIKDWKFLRAFGRIEKVLKEAGYKVYTAKIDGLGAIESNAIQLKKYIEFVIKDSNTNKVNLIAHSKGGLDSKYFLENLNNDDVVASLTTISTPFKGSPVASFILRFPKWMVSIVGWYFNVLYKIFGDENPDALRVCKQLQEVETIDNSCLNVSSNVYCQSYSTEMKKASDDFIMGIPYIFSHYFSDSQTDGLVPENSTKIGEYKGKAVEESISHSEIIDFMASKKKREKIYAFYLMIAEELSQKGF